MFNNKKTQSAGFFLIEVVVAAALISVVLISLLGLVQNTVEASQRALEKTQAGYLLEEGTEGVKTVRDQAWTNISALANDTTYYLSWDGSAWQISATPSTIDSFTRTIVFSSVSRDSNDDIVLSGGTVDSRTRKITVTVTWTPPSGTRSESLVFYIADIRT